MPESPSSSFIPKRSVGKKPTTARRSNFVLLSIISYALFVSAPLASAAVFIYERHAQNQFNKAVVSLDQAIENFKETDLKRVTDFDGRLSLTKKLLGSHVSLVKLLEAVEISTAQTVKFKSMDITRLDRSTLTVTGLLSTSKLDGALFQRSSYDASEIIKNPLFSDVVLSQVKPSNSATQSSAGAEKAIDVKVAFNFNAGDIQYKAPSSESSVSVSSAMASDTPAMSSSETVTESASSTSRVTSVTDSNI